MLKFSCSEKLQMLLHFPHKSLIAHCSKYTNPLPLNMFCNIKSSSLQFKQVFYSSFERFVEFLSAAYHCSSSPFSQKVIDLICFSNDVHILYNSMVPFYTFFRCLRFKFILRKK